MKEEDALKTIEIDTLKVAEIGKGYFDCATEKLYLDELGMKIHATDHSALSYQEILHIYSSAKARRFITSIKNGVREEQVKFEKTIEISLPFKQNKWVHIIGIIDYTKSAEPKIQFLFKDVDKETKESLRIKAKSDVLENSFKNTTEGAAYTGIDGKFIQVNPALCEMLGYSEEELIDKRVIDFVATEDLGELETILVKFLMGEISKYTGQKQYLNRQGQKIRIVLNITIIRTSRGLPLYFLFQLSDITQLFQSQTHIEKLLQLVADQNKRLLDFAYIVSHNMRSHTGNMEMLLDLLNLDFPEHTKNDYFPMMQNTVNNLQQTIEDLNSAILSYSFNEKELKTINVNKVIEDITNSFALRLKAVGGMLTNTVPKALKISHIESYLQNIFSSLLDNALKYRDSTRPLTLTISYTETPGYHIIEFTDNGIGIDLETNYHKIFRLYKTFHNAKDARGVGLFLVKNQMEALEGKIDVVSKVNEGSTFKLYFKNKNPEDIHTN